MADAQQLATTETAIEVEATATSTTTTTTTVTTTSMTATEEHETIETTTMTTEEETETVVADTRLRTKMEGGAYKFVLEYGGQAIAYWSELSELYNGHGAAVHAFIDAAAEALLEESTSAEATASRAYEQPLDLKSWLTTAAAPSKEKLGRAFYSYSLIALAQAANYVAFLDKNGLRHEEVVKHTSAAVGHSQGVVSAAVFAAAKTQEEFVQLSVSALRYMFWHGLRAQEAFMDVCEQCGEDDDLGAATPMLAVRGLTKAQVLKAVEVTQRKTQRKDVQLSLINGTSMFCVTGVPSTLELLKQALTGMMAKPDENQNRVPHSSRKPSGSMVYLNVSCAFHSAVLAPAKAVIASDVERIGFSVLGKDLQVPVYSTSSEGSNLQQRGDANVVSELIDLQLTEVADWTMTMKQLASNHRDATHLLDFGPDFGASKLSADTAEGLGLSVVATSIKHAALTPSNGSAPISGHEKLVASGPRASASWEEAYGPRTCPKTGKLVNNYTRLLKKPPVMVAGMTPTTSLNGIDLVAAIQNAGFHGELAAGGLSRPNIFESSIRELVSKIKPGLGVSINMLYLNAKQWGFQFPMVIRLRKSGVPIESITIGAGIPTKDRAVEMIAELQAVGINLICLKPGSIDGINAVLEIASAVPTMNVMLQWTGGRAGGHHSFEDFHQPLEATYAAIRRVPNVLLVVGSGFGNWEDSHAYVTGEWSLARGHHAKMPADGILLGSRVMVAKEAATAKEVKQLLVDTPGIVSELEWEQSYNDVAGGIVTVTSELGEPIHKVANRCSMLWREFDQKYFSKPREEMELAVRLDKEAIIERLNTDFQKPYFGCKIAESGEHTPAELDELTYSEVLMRMIDLMFVNIEGRPQRWLHESFLDRVVKFMARTEERFRRDTKGTSFDSSALATQPRDTLTQFIAKYPKSVTTLMSVPDCDFFLELCRSGGKPVTFIPIIDKEFKTWFKKDSLWYSEDLDAIPNRDAQRACILQGPVAVRYSTVCDEPVGKILGDIAEGFTKVVATTPQTAAKPVAVPEPKSLPEVVVEATADGHSVVLPESILPSSDEWLALLSSLTSTEWLNALVSSKFVCQGRSWVENPVLALLTPQSQQTVKVTASCIEVFDASIVGLNGPVIRISKSENLILVEVAEVRPATADLAGDIVPLQLKFTHDTDMQCSIREEDADILDRIKAFYARFWVAEQGNEEESCKAACEESVLSTFTDEIIVSNADATAYNAALGLNGGDVSVPADFSTIACWKPLIKSVFTKEVQGNLLDLVHLKHSYKLLSKTKKNFMFQAGDELVSETKVSSLRIIDSGKVVSGFATISRRTVTEVEEILEPVVELQSEFLIRGKFTDFSTTFAVEKDTSAATLARVDDVEVLKTKSWFKPVGGVALPAVGDVLEFVTTSKKSFKSTTAIDFLEVAGEVFKVEPAARTKIAEIQFSGKGVATSPVAAFVEECTRGETKETVLNDGGYTMLDKPLEIQVPENALAYAVASRDLNPIHRSKYAALLANLPQGKPIMHGMWTATKVRALTVQSFGSDFDSNVVRYDASFDGMVYPGDKLYMQARHTGMNEGCKILSIEVVNQAGERVVSARAEVKEPLMAFVFTGQGSAEIGMGMDRYKESAIARDVWDRGDKHLRETFGFSILDIVRKNPSTITVHFGGKRGRKIRENYMKLTCEDVETGELAPLLPEINSRTQSFTFSAPEGLLFATQFSQPALVLLEKAMFSEIQAANLIPDDALFAGHSLGEYAGLSSFAGALAVEDVAEVVFLRGLIMQKAVKRDSQGRSDYGMVAANPARVGPHFSEPIMHQVVEGISAASGKLLQVVNYNVEGLQYVVAGENVNLEALSISLSAIKASKQIDLKAIVADALTQAQAKKDKAIESGKPFVVARGSATIPLVGIDVPFHSSELLGGVPAFRTLLRTKFAPEVLEKQLPLLVGRYIPNLVAIPFSMEKEYVEKVYEATKSPYLAEVLDPMQWQLTTKAHLAHLLVVELLAYQFASPVQWIKTQSHLFTLGGAGIRRFVEIGPAATLTNMAQRTLQFGKFPKVSREILWYQRDRDVVHFEIESEFPSASDYARSVNVKVEEVSDEPAIVESAPAALAPPPAQVHIPAPIVQASTAPVQDAPVSAIHVLRVLLAIRLNKELPEVSVDTDVKTLSAGKSAVQNEIIGDLEKEFGSGVPDGAGEMPLKELSAKFGSYNALGKVTSGLVNKMIAGKMPGGFTMTSVKAYLSAKGLGAGRLESVLVHSLVKAPQARLKSESEAKQWLDSTTDDYAAFAGVSFARPAAAVGGYSGAMPQFASAPVAAPTVSDKPVDAKHALLVLLSAKLNKPFSEVSPETTIKELAAGKSAVQNEIVGDLEKEFGSGPDDAAESKLVDLAGKFPTYASPGKVTSAMIAKLLAGKMPGGFGLTAIKAYLSSERCLPPSRIESVLLHSLTQNPKQRFTDEAQAKSWLDGVVDDYAKFAGIEIPYLSKLGGAAGGAMAMQSMGPAALPTDFDKRLKEMIADQVDALSDYLGTDKLEWHRKVETEVELREQVESSMSVWMEEHGEFYANGIHSVFDSEKERQYDSYWNWAIQDAMVLYYRTIYAAASQRAAASSMGGGLDEHFQAMSRWINEKVDDLNHDAARPPLEWFKPLLCNRATPELLRATQFFVQKAKAEASPEYAEAVQLLVEQIETWIKRNPVNVQIFEPIRPQLTIRESGEMVYSEVPRAGVSDSIDYIDELARGLEYRFADDAAFSENADETNITMESAVGFESTMKHEDGEDSSPEESDDEEEPVVKHRSASVEVTKAQFEEPAKGPKLNALRASLKKRTTNTKPATLIERSSTLRFGLNENLKQIILPHVHVRKPSDVDPTIRLYDVEMTCKLLASMREMATTGVSFSEKVALITGCGRNSIGAELVKSLLEGGATVFVTTSSFGVNTASVFRSIYEHHGSRGSRLILLPFNQASKTDVSKLISHIYDNHKLDVDFVVPFAALSEVGRTIADIDGRSELSHRIMLTNTMRLLGEIVTAKKSRGITTRPALAILPLSPNHGNFGGDGLYAESKLGVESLMNKWYSEGWEDQISVVGAVIGWTRGTGLMSGNNIVAEGVEKLGVRTFSTKEMGFNLSALMHPTIVDMASEAPLWADLTGGMAQMKDLKNQVDSIRKSIMADAKLKAALFAARQSETVDTSVVAAPSSAFKPRANLSDYYCSSFPSMAGVQRLAGDKPQTLLGDMINLRNVVVVTGFGEVSPWGNARTRWEMESFGEFSIEGCIELAWLTGHIVYNNGSWVDAKTKEVVADHEIKARYEEELIKHSGIRIIEPDLFEGYDPKHKMVLHQVAIDKKMAPIEVADQEEALQFRSELGKENVDIFQNASGAWMIRLRKGAVLSIPRALSFDRFVAGQIPTGWSAERLGLPKDIADSVDPVTLYTLASTMDAFVSAGVTDPYEFYQYVHVSEVGNTSGGGMGGMRSFKRIYQGRLLGKSVASDTLQECFINTAPAWVNMLLLSSSGPIKTPVGACATAAESVDIGVDTIKSGKARVVIVGGYDDFGEEGSYEFAQMKATSDSVKEMRQGRDPREMCRPCTTTRGGFMESQGAGMQLLMDAQLALEMGCPIYAIVALTSTATDKNGRSVPAPGQGILTTARESSADAATASPLLDVEYRRRQFDAEIESIETWYAREKTFIDEQNEAQVAFLDDMKRRKVQSAQSIWGDEFFANRADIAPLRGALSVWNLTVDDLGVASFHGTGTTANDKNESDVTQKQLAHLGRSKGNVLPVICQKNITGHPKGAAAAWMLNGLLQVLSSGLIPGNRNLDNTCSTLRKFDYLMYPNRSIQTDGIKAALMKSFGFGQAGGEVLLVHPDYLLSTLPANEFQLYSQRRQKRLTSMNSYVQKSISGKHKFIQIKDSAPYTSAQESSVYLDPTARAEYDPVVNTWHFGPNTDPAKKFRAQKRAKKAKTAVSASPASADIVRNNSSSLLSAMNEGLSSSGLAAKNFGIGVDVEPVMTFENLHGREDFIRRNFTDQEMAYCYSAPHPAASFAGRWAAKEAVIKAISSAAPNEGNMWKGAGAPLREIEIFMTASGAPSVLLSGHPHQVFNRVGLSTLSVSISHSGDYAVAQAVASFSA